MLDRKSFYIHDDVLNSIEQDTFGHKHIADAIVNSIINTKPPFIVGVFGSWGTGKSSLLRIINEQLGKNSIETVTIDAWKYTSAKNLQRSLLVHVANEKSPKLLDELRRKIYTSEQETLPAKRKRFEENKIFTFQQFLRILLNFLCISLVLFLFLFILFSASEFLSLEPEQRNLSSLYGSYKWGELLDKFLDLLFVPLLIALANFLQLNIFQRQITISHERIDADELFTEYFDKIIDKVLKKKSLKKKRLVIFVDNLDRLTDEKMVEALESLKTYISNEKCIFVVACDDEVVRSVINQSDEIPGSINNNSKEKQLGIRAGEHYLDKFFQQTFRLPEYMDLDLQDFAEKNFAKTELYDRLIKSGIDIKYLISIILPSDVGSPRKVKRLLNDFIAIFDIVERREKLGVGQLRPGLLTKNPEFLGKFSTIRTEFPDFYKLLVEDTKLLTDVTELIRARKEEEIEKLLNSIKTKINIESLISYLRKTQSIMEDDIGPYIWLSQDTLTLELPREQVRDLNNSLSNGDIESFKEQYSAIDDDDKKEALVRIASRIVENRLVGIDQRNGSKILAHSLTFIPETIKPEIAHVVANLIPLWSSIESLNSHEVLNILRWAHRENNSQKRKLLEQLIDRLDQKEERESTFSSILENHDLICELGEENLVSEWLEKILTYKTESNETKTEEQEKEDDSFDIEFADWIVFNLENYKGRNDLIESYFSTSLVEYYFARLLGDSIDKDPIVISDEKIGEILKRSLNVIVEFIKEKNECDEFWNGLIRLIENTNILENFSYALSLTNETIEQIPESLKFRFQKALFIGINNLIATVPAENKVDWLSNCLTLILELQRSISNETIYSSEEVDEVSSLFADLVELKSENNPEFIRFAEQYTNEFSKDDHHPILSGLVKSFSKLLSENNYGEPLLNSIIDLKTHLNKNDVKVIFNSLDSQIKTNDPNQIKISKNYIEKLHHASIFDENISSYTGEWVEILKNDAWQLFVEKFIFLSLLVQLDLLDANTLVEKIIPLFPLGNEQNKLALTTQEMSKFAGSIKPGIGDRFFKTIIQHIGSFGETIIDALSLLVNWIDRAEEAQISIFVSNLFNQFPKHPFEVISILEKCWHVIPRDRINQILIQMYSVEGDSEFSKIREQNTKLALDQIANEEKIDFIMNIWENLINSSKNADNFLEAVINGVDLIEVNNLREKAISEIRENGASPTSEKNLRFLKDSVRDDVREVMPVVDLFVNLFGRGEDDIRLALKYVVQVLTPLGIRNDHKHKLAEAMGNAALRSTDQINAEIHEKAEQLGLKWFSYRKYWE